MPSFVHPMHCCNAIIEDMKKLVMNFALVEISFIPRMFNLAAHSLAKLCNYSSNQDIEWERALIFLEEGS